MASNPTTSPLHGNETANRLSAEPTAAPGAPQVLALVAFAAFASMASMRACDSILPLLAAEFSVSKGVAAQTISGFAVAYGLLQFFYGPLADRLGKLRVMTVAVALCALANTLISVAPSLELVTLARAFAGAAGGGIVPLSIALIGDTVAYHERQETLSRLMVVTISGLIAGQWLGGLVADWLGWRLLFAGLAAGFAVLVWPMRRAQSRIPAPPAEVPGEARPTLLGQLKRLLRRRWARLILALVALEGAFAFATISFVPVTLNQTFGLSIARSGAVMALFGVGGLAYALGARALIARLGERRMALTGGLIVGLGMAIIALAPRWEWAALGCFLGGVGLYMMHNTLQANASQMMPAIRGTSVAMFAACFFSGQSVGVAVEALVIDAGSPRAMFAAASLALPLLGAYFAWGLRRRDAWQGADG
jgi:MFS family permease